MYLNELVSTYLLHKPALKKTNNTSPGDKYVNLSKLKAFADDH